MIRNSFKAALGLFLGVLLAITSISPANAALPGLVPVFANPVGTRDGFTVQITNFDPSFDWASTADVGTTSDISNAGLLTVSGANPSTMVTVHVSTARVGYDTANASISATSLQAALGPNADNPVRTVDGFTFPITNYDGNFTWVIETSVGTSDVSETGVVTISGLSPNESAQVTISTSRPGYANGLSVIVSSALSAGLIPEFGEVTRTPSGYEVEITNFDGGFTYSVQTNAGTASFAVISNGYFVITTGLTANEESTITVVAQRDGFADGSASLTDSTFHACLAGTYSATGYGSCSSAPAGRYVPTSGQTQPTPCAVGTYQPDTGRDSCLEARAGYYVDLTGATTETPCQIGTFQPSARSGSCVSARIGFFVDITAATAETECPAGMTTLVEASDGCVSQTSTGYSGPTLVGLSDLVAAPGQTLSVSGTGLSQVSFIEISGLRAVATCTDTSCSFTVPSGVSAGLQNLLIIGSHGVLTIQDGIRIDLTISSESTVVTTWTKKLDDNSAKIYAKNIVGGGKVQFFLNGKEIAWVNASSSADSKLRSANGSSYLVRTVEFAAGKNVLEVYVDGVRTTRAAYAR